MSRKLLDTTHMKFPGQLSPWISPLADFLRSHIASPSSRQPSSQDDCARRTKSEGTDQPHGTRVDDRNIGILCYTYSYKGLDTCDSTTENQS